MKQQLTGIKGLDDILCGGIMPGSATLLEGPPGCGKTTLGIQFIVNGILNGEPGIIITFEQFADQLYHDAQNFGWDLIDLQRKNTLRVICTSPSTIRDHLLQSEGIIHKLIDQIGVKRVLIDSVSHFHRITETKSQMRELLFSMINALKQKKITIALTKELGLKEEPSFEEYVVDAIINLSYEHHGQARVRTVEVIKTRGHDHVSGKHFFKFGPNGITIFPRQFKINVADTPNFKEFIPTGIDGLDQMMGGGISRGSNILLCGPAGTGKTTLSLQSMYNSMTKYGNRAVLFLTGDSAESILRMANGFGWDMQGLQDQGLFKIIDHDFTKINIDEHLKQIDHVLSAFKPALVSVDALPAMLQVISDQPGLIAEKLNFLNSLFKAYRCISFLIVQSPFGSNRISAYGVEEALCDGIVILGSQKIGHVRRRSIEVYKLRNQKHVFGECGMDISDHGIRVFYVGRGEDK